MTVNEAGYPTHRYRAIADLTPAEERIFATLGHAKVLRQRREVFRREGEATAGIHLLVEGWVSSSITLASGKRLIQKIHLPGDMLGTPSMVLAHSADTLTAITDAVTSFVSYEAIGQLFVTAPRLAAMFAIALQMERLALMDALAATGNASAREQVARMLVDLHARLSACGSVQDDDSFAMPLTQEIIGDLLGLTSVHVNRTLRALETEGLIAREGQRIRLVDLAALRRLSPVPQRKPLFSPGWLPPTS